MYMCGRKDDKGAGLKSAQAGRARPFDELTSECRATDTGNPDQHRFECLRGGHEGEPDEITGLEFANFHAELDIIDALLTTHFFDVFDLAGTWHDSSFRRPLR